tara:strand:- start:2813 stop:3055 length:243 start_codon:yes stop_codon:yes gene_type:complete
MSLERSTGPWFVADRYVRQKLDPRHVVAKTYKGGDTQLIAKTPELVAVLKMLLANRNDPHAFEYICIAAEKLLREAGELE